MVIRTHWLGLAGIGLLFSLSLFDAKGFPAYRVGDTAEETIATPVALDVIDTVATAARKAVEALKTPAIFRSYPNPTNAMVREFTGDFEKGRTSYTAILRQTFGEITNADELVNSDAFAEFVATFNHKKPAFPVTMELAKAWARGETGAAIRGKLIVALVNRTLRPIRPDDSTNSQPLGDTLRLVIVDSPTEYLNLADAEQRGKLATTVSVTTVSRLRDLFRRDYAREDQPMALAIGKLIRPNCEMDVRLTQEARARDVSQIVVMSHYNAGQIVVQRDMVVDAKAEAAIAQLNARLAAEHDHALAQAQREQIQADAAQAAELKVREQQLNLEAQALATRNRNQWLIVALAGGSVLALAALWLVARNRRRESSWLPMPVEKTTPQQQYLLHPGLAPQIAQVLKEAVVQGLAAQRSELLQAQQTAAAEISELVHRLDGLKAPIQERLRSYETRIVELEKDLAERNQENRELLKLKIEMTRRQLEAERARNRVGFN